MQVDHFEHFWCDGVRHVLTKGAGLGGGACGVLPWGSGRLFEKIYGFAVHKLRVLMAKKGGC
jgi:hypothetical protein